MLTARGQGYSSCSRHTAHTLVAWALRVLQLCGRVMWQDDGIEQRLMLVVGSCMRIDQAPECLEATVAAVVSSAAGRDVGTASAVSWGTHPHACSLMLGR